MQSILTRAAGGGHEDAVAHNNRARSAPARQRRLPRDVFARFNIEMYRQAGFLRYAPIVRTAKLPPLGDRGLAHTTNDQGEDESTQSMIS